jgi:hypothetical protein
MGDPALRQRRILSNMPTGADVKPRNPAIFGDRPTIGDQSTRSNS